MDIIVLKEVMIILSEVTFLARFKKATLGGRLGVTKR